MRANWLGDKKYAAQTLSPRQGHCWPVRRLSSLLSRRIGCSLWDTINQFNMQAIRFVYMFFSPNGNLSRESKRELVVAKGKKCLSLSRKWINAYSSNTLLSLFYLFFILLLFPLPCLLSVIPNSVESHFWFISGSPIFNAAMTLRNHAATTVNKLIN